MLVTKFLSRVQDTGLYHQQYSNLQVEIMSKLKGSSRETKKTFEEGAGQTIETKIRMLGSSSYKMEKDIEMIRSVVSKCVDMLEKVVDGKLDAMKMKSLQKNSLSSLKLCIGALTKMEERSSAMLRLSGFTRSMTYYFMRVGTEERGKRKVEHALERQ